MKQLAPLLFLLVAFFGLQEALAVDVEKEELITIEVDELPITKELASTGRKKLWKVTVKNNSTEPRYVTWGTPQAVKFGLSCLENGKQYEIISECSSSFRTFVFPNGPLGAKIMAGHFIEVTAKASESTCWIMDPHASFSVYERSLKAIVLGGAESGDGELAIPKATYEIVPSIQRLQLDKANLSRWINDLQSDFPDQRESAMRLIAKAASSTIKQVEKLVEPGGKEAQEQGRKLLAIRQEAILRAHLTRISGRSYEFAAPKFTMHSSENVLYSLSADDKQAVVAALTKNVGAAQSYSVKVVYGVGDSTTGPYSIPPPRVSIYVFKEKPLLSRSRDCDIHILTNEYVLMEGFMFKNEELVRSLSTIVDKAMTK